MVVCWGLRVKRRGFICRFCRLVVVRVWLAVNRFFFCRGVIRGFVFGGGREDNAVLLESILYSV